SYDQTRRERRPSPRRAQALSLPLDPHIFLLEGAPAGGADCILALLEGGKIPLDAACVAILLQRLQHPLRRTDRRAVGLRRIDAEAKTHRIELARRQHRRLTAFEHIDECWPPHIAADDAQFLDILRSLDKADISARVEISVNAVNRRLQPLDRSRVGTGD